MIIMSLMIKLHTLLVWAILRLEVKKKVNFVLIYSAALCPLPALSEVNVVM